MRAPQSTNVLVFALSAVLLAGCATTPPGTPEPGSPLPRGPDVFEVRAPLAGGEKFQARRKPEVMP